jgi:predicted transcriptional regulator
MMTHARDTNLVRKRREELQIKLVDLAARAKCSAPLISMIEGGLVPQLSTMVKVADALDTTPIALWPDEVEEIGV